MSICQFHSTVVLPKTAQPYPLILTFLARRFPFIEPGIWEHRIRSGKVLDEKGLPICLDTPYEPLKKLLYFREVAEEPFIPFAEEILFCNQDLLVAFKPHFLPVTPGGSYVNECLVNRLKNRLGNGDISPINRIDRDTAGLVLFSMNRDTRGRYQEMFMEKGRVEKTYEAVALCDVLPEQRQWQVANRLVKGQPWFRMTEAPGGDINAISNIRLMDWQNGRAFFYLFPVTGKKHQLRVHLSSLGFPIINDRYYPELLPERPPDFKAPLQLLAKKIRFQDPVTGALMQFETRRTLWPHRNV